MDNNIRKDIDKQLEKMHDKIRRLKIKKIPNTFLSIIDKNFDEVTISRCIAFLINPEYTSLKVIEQILNISQSQMDEEDFLELLNNEETIFESLEVEVAISLRSRIDILVKFSTFWIVIENKIYSYENNDQSIKYEEDLKKQTDLPIKYLCLKPQYNQCKIKNRKFNYITYNQIMEILKTITKYDLSDEENYYFIEDFIKHTEVFLMNESELQIGEDIEFYIDNKKTIESILSNYKKQCELVRDKLETSVKTKFIDQYTIYCSRYGYLQIWKNNWHNEEFNGIHYEILCDFNHIIGYDTTVKFAIHNEGKTRKTLPEIKHRTLKEIKYNFDSSKSVEESIKQIVSEMYEIVQNNNEFIDNILKSK